MTTPLRILHLEDRPMHTDSAESLLRAEGIDCTITLVDTRSDFQGKLEHKAFDLIIADFTLPAFDGRSALKLAQQKCPELPVIFLSSTIGQEKAVELLKEGATDLLKGRIKRLVSAVRRAVREAEDRGVRRHVEEELHQRHELFRQITDNVDDLIAVVDLEGKILFSSASYRRLLGGGASEPKTDWFAAIHADDRKRIGEKFQHMVATGSGQRAEFRFVPNTGSPRLVESQWSVSRGKDGKIENVVVVSRDVTERKRAEKALQKSEQRFHTLAKASPVGIVQSNAAGACLYVNERWCEIAGLGLFEAVGEGWTRGLHPEDRDRVYAQWQQAIHRESPFISTYRFQRTDGKITWVLGQALAERGNDGQIVGYVGTITDITESRQAEERIREQAALLDIAHDAIYVTDLQQRILYWNRGAERLYGWTAKEALGRNAYELLFQGDVAAPVAALKILIKKDEWHGEWPQISKNGESSIVESRWTLLRDQERRPKSVLMVNTDITERKQMQAQLLRAQRMECIGGLAGGIAHDLNNVLTPIMMTADLLRSQINTTAGREKLDTIVASVNRGSEMIKQILSFARGVGSEQAVLQIKLLVNEVVQLVKRTFPRSIRIHADVAPDLHRVIGNATQLHQVLMNLCVNARDAMPNGGSLHIEAINVMLNGKAIPMSSQPAFGPYLVLTVSDTGTGIPVGLLDKIFSPFFTTKGEGKGTGLGLSTVRDIVQHHGGFVDLASEEGKGSSFRVYLPATTMTETEFARQKSPVLPMGQGELVLVVDDEIAILEITKVFLEEFNHRVLTARNGAEGLAVFRQHKEDIKVVVTDMMMPVMDGGAMIQELQKINPQIHVIGVSGLDLRSGLTEATRHSMRAFLTKPYSLEQLLTAVREVLKPK